MASTPEEVSRFCWDLARRVPFTYDTLKAEVKHSYCDFYHSQKACFLRLFSIDTASIRIHIARPDGCLGTRLVLLNCKYVKVFHRFRLRLGIVGQSSSEFVLVLVSLISDALRTYLGITYICRQKRPWVDVRRCTRMLPKLESIKVAPDIIRSQQREYDVKFLMALLQNGEAQEKSNG